MVLCYAFNKAPQARQQQLLPVLHPSAAAAAGVIELVIRRKVQEHGRKQPLVDSTALVHWGVCPLPAERHPVPVDATDMHIEEEIKKNVRCVASVPAESCATFASAAEPNINMPTTILCREA